MIEEMTRDLLAEYSDAPPDTDEWRGPLPTLVKPTATVIMADRNGHHG